MALLYEELDSALQPLGQPWEAVFVDDGSGDGSFAALTRLHDAKDNVRVIRLRRNFGKATALATGFAHAEGDIVVTIDADLQDDPAEIHGSSPSSTRASTSSPAGRLTAATRSPAHSLEDLQLGHRPCFRAPAPRSELRAQGVPRGGRAGPARSTASCTGSSPSSRTIAAIGSPSCRSTTVRVSTAARATASSATYAASSTC